MKDADDIEADQEIHSYGSPTAEGGQHRIMNGIRLRLDTFANADINGESLQSDYLDKNGENDDSKVKSSHTNTSLRRCRVSQSIGGGLSDASISIVSGKDGPANFGSITKMGLAPNFARIKRNSQRTPWLKLQLEPLDSVGANKEEEEDEDDEESSFTIRDLPESDNEDNCNNVTITDKAVCSETGSV